MSLFACTFLKSQSAQHIAALAESVSTDIRTVPWNYGKIMFLGDGRGGKTTLVDSLMGRPFSNNLSTRGIKEEMCQINMSEVTDSGVWSKREDKYECEAGIAIAHSVKKQLAQQNNIASIADSKPNTATDFVGFFFSGRSAVRRPFAAPKPKPLAAKEKEFVVRLLQKHTNMSMDSKLNLSLFDFGGQSVFNAIHHLFLTTNGVYCIVFNMQWLTQGSEAEKYLYLTNIRHWLNTVVIHGKCTDTGKIAPVVFIGTHKDYVEDPNDHQKISTLLVKTFELHPAWPEVQKYAGGTGARGATKLFFYPLYSCSERDRDPVLTDLMKAIESLIYNFEYLKDVKPLVWLQTYDRIRELNRCYLSLREVEDIGRAYNMSADQCHALLRFLNNMGMLLWIEEDALRQQVIVDPINFFVDPATKVICDHTTSADQIDQTIFREAIHDRAQRKMPSDWKKMVTKGVVSRGLMEYLLSDHDEVQRSFVMQLMEKYGLAVPIHDDDPLHVAVSNNTFPVNKYVIPALLPFCESSFEFPCRVDVTLHTCAFVFSLHLQDFNCPVPQQQLRQFGFLPHGFFERLLGKVLTWSQVTCRVFPDYQIFRDRVVASYGTRRFMLKVMYDRSIILLHVEGGDPVPVFRQVNSQIADVRKECMGTLEFVAALLYPDTVVFDDTTVLFPLHAVKLNRKGQFNNAALDALNPVKYDVWLNEKVLEDAYDLFNTYRWGNRDSPFVEGLHERYTLCKRPGTQQSVKSFLDKERLQDGEQFQQAFMSALRHSAVVTPVVSSDALVKMRTHDANDVDNLLLEWLLSLELVGRSDIQKIYPIMVGRRPGSDALVKWDQAQVTTLPNTVPAKTLELVNMELAKLGLQPRYHPMQTTVRSTIIELLKYQYFDVADVKADSLTHQVTATTSAVLAVLANCQVQHSPPPVPPFPVPPPPVVRNSHICTYLPKHYTYT
jgi:GTPase SAR1 family protein